MNPRISSTSLSVTVAPNAVEVGDLVASQILDRIEAAAPDGFVLACPAGRSPTTTYAALVRDAGRRRADLSRVTVVLVDEYAARRPDGGGDGRDGGFVLCDPAAHYSCRRFAEEHLLAPLDAALPPERRIPRCNVLVPDPTDPAGFDARLAAIGGIDFMLLASGASDGHVAFIPPGSSPDDGTRVIEIAESTRRDNLATFPEFPGIEAVPTHGVSIGLGTVVSARHVVLLLLGRDKAAAFERLVACDGFDGNWPASVVHLCDDAAVIADAAAASSTDPS